MHRLNNFFWIGISILLFCGSCSRIGIATKTKELKRENLCEQNYYLHNEKVKSISINKFTADYENNRTKESYNINGYMNFKVDSAILISVRAYFGIEAAKLLFLPDKFKFYNRLQKNFYDNKFPSLFNFGNGYCNISKLQQLFLGYVIFDDSLASKKEINNSETEISGFTVNRDKDSIFYNFIVSKKDLRLRKLILSSKKYNLKIEGEFLKYAIYKSLKLPKEIKIKYQDKDNDFSADIQIKKVEFNQVQKFSFKIPEGFKPVM
jgi:hypothetical protein